MISHAARGNVVVEMVAWRESGQDEWRFERLRVLVERVSEAIRPVRPRRRDLEQVRKRRDAAGDR